MRSLWKGAFVNFNLFNYVRRKPGVRNRKIVICSRNTTFLKSMVGSLFLIYNGKKYISIRVRRGMIGYKAGYFVYTKKTGHRIHLTKKKKKRKILKKK